MKGRSLYVNGELEGIATDASIVPSAIRNDAPLGLGHGGGYEPLGRGVHLVRLWNRSLTAAEIRLLWEGFVSHGQHGLPPTFDRREIHSEWLMHEIGDAHGRDGNTHVMDTAGANHLELHGGAEVVRGNGPLTLREPPDASASVDKAVYVTASGGRESLEGDVTLPLHYFFQVDESPDLNTPELRESGWFPHYGRWSPILKPSTVYYWRARIRDLSYPPKESGVTATQTFTTEGPSVWYVRPRTETSVYGTEDGRSHENAFNGLVNWDDRLGAFPGIVWGPNGVEAGDTLYICDTHNIPEHDGGFADYRRVYIKTSGHSEAYPVTVRGDCPEHAGVIVGGEDRYALVIDRRRHLVFKNIGFDGFDLQTESLTGDGNDVTATVAARSTHIVFDGCMIRYGASAFFDLYRGHDYWEFRNNTMSFGTTGIKTIGRGGGGTRFLTVEHSLFSDIGVPPFEHKDAHAVGIQGGEGHLIQYNHIENTGAAIEFWAGTNTMRDMTVRYNFIKDTHNKEITEGGGIVVSGANFDSLGQRTGFKIYGNIIVNAEGAGISRNNKDLVEVYNNVIYKCRIGLQFAVMDGALGAAVHNNIVVEPAEYFVFVAADVNRPWDRASWNHNIYWPSEDGMELFDTTLTLETTFDTYRQALGWDADSLLENPRFVSNTPQEARDFMLRGDSPAIDAGTDVGVDVDFAGNPIPRGIGPDIGAYEYGPLMETDCEIDDAG